MKTEKGAPPVIRNRKARREYDISDTYEAGIALVGAEVKSIRAGKADIQDAYCEIEGMEVWIINMYVAPYDQSALNSETRRKRKLLMHRDEIQRLYGKVTERGLTLVPITLYFKHGKVKLEIGIARGKRLYDKREAIKERDIRREMDKAQISRQSRD